MWNAVHAILNGFYLTLHNGKLVRRTVLGVAVYCQYVALEWAMAFATAMPPSIDAAAMIAAILTPTSALFAAAVKFYHDARVKENTSKDKENTSKDEA